MKYITKQGVVDVLLAKLEVRPPANPKVRSEHTVAWPDEHGFPIFMFSLTEGERVFLAKRLLEGLPHLVEAVK